MTQLVARVLLPPPNEVWGKVIFLHVCVILSMGEVACVVAGGCMVAGGHAWLQGGHAWLWGVCVVMGGHVWLRRACVAVGGMCGWGVCGCGGACMVAGWMWHAWLPGRGMCLVAGGGGV